MPRIAIFERGPEKAFTFLLARPPARRRRNRTAPLSRGCGVGNNEDPVTDVGRTDTRSWKYNRLYFVPFSFQVSEHLFEDHSPVKTK